MSGYERVGNAKQQHHGECHFSLALIFCASTLVLFVYRINTVHHFTANTRLCAHSNSTLDIGHLLLRYLELAKLCEAVQDITRSQGIYRTLYGSPSDSKNPGNYRRTAALTITSDQSHDTVVIKAVLNHPRVKNEADFLKLYQTRSPHLRPLVHEIIEPYNYLTIALRHLDDHLLNASIDRAVNRQ
jgi:hypothetical protein